MLRTVHEHAAASGDDSLHLLQQAVRLQVVHRFAQAFIALRELVGGHAAVRLPVVELILALQRPLVVAGEVLAARQQAGWAHLLCRVLWLRSQDVRVNGKRQTADGGAEGAHKVEDHAPARPVVPHAPQAPVRVPAHGFG